MVCSTKAGLLLIHNPPSPLVCRKKLKYTLESKEVKYLVENNPNLLQLFQKKDEVIVNIDDDYFVSLVGTIVAQQLSN